MKIKETLSNVISKAENSNVISNEEFVAKFQQFEKNCKQALTEYLEEKPSQVSSKYFLFVAEKKGDLLTSEIKFVSVGRPDSISPPGAMVDVKNPLMRKMIGSHIDSSDRFVLKKFAGFCKLMCSGSSAHGIWYEMEERDFSPKPRCVNETILLTALSDDDWMKFGKKFYEPVYKKNCKVIHMLNREGVEVYYDFANERFGYLIGV